MAGQNGRQPDLAVIVDAAGETSTSAIDWESLRLPVDDIVALEKGRAKRPVESLARTIVVDGDDRLLSRAVTAYQRRHVGRDRPLRFVPLRTGRFHRVATDLQGPTPRARLAKLLADEGVPEHWSEVRRRSLRVTTSARPAPYWGFSLGAGAMFDLFETVVRADGTGLSGWSSVGSSLVRRLTGGDREQLEPVAARFSVDYRPRGEQLGYLLASGLDATWLGVSTGEGSPGWVGGTSAREFAAEIAGSAALPDFLRRGASPFDRIHIDGPGGFVLDGRLLDPGEPHVLQVAAGPSVRFVTP